jgi:hypothetical protein
MRASLGKIPDDFRIAHRREIHHRLTTVFTMPAFFRRLHLVPILVTEGWDPEL